MLPIIGAAVLGGVVVFVATRDEMFRIERSVHVRARCETVFSVLRDFRLFEHWSPWEKLDSNMQKTFTGEPGTVGASYAWSGNDKVGQGTMTVLEVEPNQGIDLRLEFFKPFASVCTTRWAAAREGEHTIVTWTMKGKHKNLAQRVFGVVMSRMLTKSFDEGLARLKAYCEKLPAPVSAEPATGESSTHEAPP